MYSMYIHALQIVCVPVTRRQFPTPVVTSNPASNIMHWNPVFGSDECLLILDELISFHSFEPLENVPLWSQKCPDDLLRNIQFIRDL
jgi:hypothetical protein